MMAANISRFLILLDVAMMTKYFAISNLIEAILILLFLSNRELRSELCNSIKDARVFFLFIFFLWICIACLWGQAPLSDRIEEVVSWRKLILVPFAFVLFPLQKHKELFLVVVVIVCLPYLIVSSLAYFHFIQLHGEPSHLLENHTTQSILFSSCIYITYYFLQRSSPKISFKNLIAFTIGLAFFANLIMLNTSKSGFIFFLIVIGIIVILNMVQENFKYKNQLIFILPIILTLFLSENIWMIFSESLGEFQSIEGRGFSGSTSMRYVMWMNTVSLIEASPLLGTGSGSFKIAYAELVANEEGWLGTITDDPHNQYLLIAAEQGLIGLALFILVIISVLIHLINTRAFVPAALIGGILATSLFNGHFGTFVEGRFVWLLIGVFASGSHVRLPNVISSFMANKRWD